MDVTAGATTGGAAGAFATALVAMAFFKFKGMLGMQSKLVGAGHSDTDCSPYYSIAKPRRRHNNVYSLNNAWEASGRCMI